MIKGISAVDAIKSTAKKTVSKIKENKDGIIATGALGAGMAGYGALLHSYVKGDEVVISSNTQSADNNIGLLQKIKEKIKDKFTIDLDHVPEGVDQTQKYITDIDGNILYSDITCMPYPNPWYDPELAAKSVKNITNIAENSDLHRVTMEEFIDGAANHGSEIAAGITSFGGEDVDLPSAETAESTWNSIVETIKEVVDNAADLV